MTEVTTDLLPEHRERFWTDRVGNLWVWRHDLSEWCSGPRFGGYNPRNFGPFTEFASEQHYIETTSTRQTSELVVNTNPDGWSTKIVEFEASDEREDAIVRLTRADVERLHMQLGAWLAVTPE